MKKWNHTKIGWWFWRNWWYKFDWRRGERQYFQWLKYADKYKMWLTLTDNHIKSQIKKHDR